MANESEQPGPPMSPASPEPSGSTSSPGPEVISNETNNSSSSPSAVQPPEPENRAELLSKARAFLHQPQIQREDVFSKRRFLAEKGLNETEIQGLMRELPVQVPSVPPRSYPQPPPSNLPVLLLGLARLFSWIVGGSTALAFIYYRILLPRITESSMARNSLKSHQLSLLRKLNTSLASLKESQAAVATVLPTPELHKEPAVFAACLSVDALLEQAQKEERQISDIPAISLLRCGISDFQKGEDPRDPNTEELFQILQGKIPWLVSPEAASFEQHLWETLSTCPLFIRDTSPKSTSTPPVGDQQGLLYWSYTPLPPLPPTPSVQALTALLATIPKPSPEKHSPFQHALQSLSDFTGYLSSQMYVPYRPIVNRVTGTLGPAEEELRKEIRALKGLVLNRRSFMPSPMRPQS
ncbi:hypothetical protein C8J57DRAFT_1294046 [Mycena rebaudengoi]|nr:hypothetical protein C8J57DRAFT_1294046 [Mycena rebaudengoi]